MYLDQFDTSSHHTEAVQEDRYENYRDTWVMDRSLVCLIEDVTDIISTTFTLGIRYFGADFISWTGQEARIICEYAVNMVALKRSVYNCSTLIRLFLENSGNSSRFQDGYQNTSPECLSH